MSSLTLSKEEEKRLKGLGFLNNKGTDNFSARILTVNGKVTAAQHRAMADAAETFGNGILTFTTRQTVEVQGIPYEKLEEFQEFVENAGMAIGGTGAKVRPVVSCKGTTCQYGLLDSFAISEEIHKRFYEGYHDVKLPHKFKIAVGGCPNNCVKPNLNDLGIIGQRIPHFKAELCKGCKKCSVEAVCPMGAAKVSDKKYILMKMSVFTVVDVWKTADSIRLQTERMGLKFLLADAWGKKISHGRALSKVFTTKDEAMDVIEKAILLFRERGLAGERFAVMIDRIGFETVEEALLRDDSLLERKEEILSREL